jgi:hypothetical protein
MSGSTRICFTLASSYSAATVKCGPLIYRGDFLGDRVGCEARIVDDVNQFLIALFIRKTLAFDVLDSSKAACISARGIEREASSRRRRSTRSNMLL